GGNVGAFLAALLLKYKSAAAEKIAIASSEGLGQEAIQAAQSAASSSAVSSGYLIIGLIVVVSGLLSLTIKFSTEDEKVVNEEKAVNIEIKKPAKEPVPA